MNILKSIKPLSITFVLIILVMSHFKKLEPRERITEPDHTITSKILGRDYQLYISFLKIIRQKTQFLIQSYMFWTVSGSFP
jgi:hypothetical protein